MPRAVAGQVRCAAAASAAVCLCLSHTATLHCHRLKRLVVQLGSFFVPLQPLLESVHAFRTPQFALPHPLRRLKRLVPRLGNFFVPLRLLDAFREYDAVFALSRRRYIPPNFAELRHVVNIAQVRLLWQLLLQLLMQLLLQLPMPQHLLGQTKVASQPEGCALPVQVHASAPALKLITFDADGGYKLAA